MALKISENDYTCSLTDFPAKHLITTRDFGNCASRYNLHQNDRLHLLMEEFGAHNAGYLDHEHGGNIVILNDVKKHNIRGYTGDALVHFRLIETKDYYPLLLSTTGDCPVVMLTDRMGTFTAIIHSGWKGTKLDIVGSTIRRIVEFATNYLYPKLRFKKPRVHKMIAGIWPGICKECFEVGPEFERFFPQDYDRGHLSLKGIIMRQLIEAGILPENIFTSDLCSMHSRNEEGAYKFFSYRRLTHSNLPQVPPEQNVCSFYRNIVAISY